MIVFQNWGFSKILKISFVNFQIVIIFYCLKALDHASYEFNYHASYTFSNCMLSCL